MKVFGVGWQRTGTSSLTAALNILGIPSRQYPWQLADDLDHPIIERYDGFTDNPIPLLFRELDRRHPSSRFVLTVRDEDAWLASARWLMSAGAEKFDWENLPRAFEFVDMLYGQREFNEAVFRERYRRHNREVLDYFSRRSEDLLVMDITTGEGWEKLCPFLERPEPGVAFPHRNIQEPRWRNRLRKLLRRLAGRMGS